MDKQQSGNRVRAVREYLAGIGHEVTLVQGHEIVARALGFKNKHVLAAQAATRAPKPSEPDVSVASGHREGLPVMALTDKPLTAQQLLDKGWAVDIIVPFGLDQLDVIDTMNDYASRRITGNEAALSDISFDHEPDVNYGKGWVAYRVRGRIEEPELWYPEKAGSAEETFYSDLLELAQRVKGNVTVRVTSAGVAWDGVTHTMYANAVTLLRTYAREKGANNDAVNRHAMDTLFTCRVKGRPLAEPEPEFRLHDLKYAVRSGPNSWSFDWQGQVATLEFLD